MIVNLEQIINNLKIKNKIDDNDFMFLKVCYVIYIYICIQYILLEYYYTTFVC